MEKEKQNILIQKFEEDLLKENPHIKKEDIRVIISGDSKPKIELKANIFKTDREGGLKYPKNWHYEYDRGFVYSDSVEYFDVKIEHKPLEDIRHPIDIVYELERLNPDKKFGYDPSSHEIITDVSIESLNLDELKNKGGKIENGRLYFPNILVNGEVVEVGLKKEYTIGEAINDLMTSIKAVDNLMGGAKAKQEDAVMISRDGSSNIAHATATENSAESNVVQEDSHITDGEYFQRLKDAIENYEYRTTGGNDGTEKEAVAFDTRSGEKVYNDRVNAEYNAARKWLKLVCSYRGISITQEDWNNPEIKTQRIREAFDSEMRNVFVVFVQAKETLRQYYDNKPIERVLDILDKIPDSKNKKMVTDLIENYIEERDENLYKAFAEMKKNRELNQDQKAEEMVRTREIKGNY